MTSRILLWPDAAAGMAIAIIAALIAVLPPIPRLVAAVLLAAAPLLFFAIASPTAWLGVFLPALLLAPPLPLSIGNSGAHPALALIPVGILAAVVCRTEWRGRMGPIGLCAVLLGTVMLASVA